MLDQITLQKDLESFCDRVRKKNCRDADLAKASEVHLDGHAAWVHDMLNSKTIHDEDYIIFSKFQDGYGTILDVGANWGYSVGSIRATGCALPIVSFEIIPNYQDCLAAVKKELGTKFDYVICGVGSKAEKNNLYIPVLNSTPLTALSTVVLELFDEWMVKNIMDYVKRYMSEEKEISAKVLVNTVEIDTLDHILQQRQLAVSVESIAAIKIDVEGLEGEVLKGAEHTISKNKPLLLLEGADRRPDVRDFIKKYEYLITQRNDNMLTIPYQGNSGRAVNGIFVHPSMLDIYRRWGLLEGVA